MNESEYLFGFFYLHCRNRPRPTSRNLRFPLIFLGEHIVKWPGFQLGDVTKLSSLAEILF